MSRIGVYKAVVFAVGCLPLAAVTASLFADPTPDPYERLAHTTGEFALRFLLLTLLVTPLKDVLKLKRLGAFRRTLGVLAFTYTFFHFLAYMVFEAGFDPAFVSEDIAQRRFILFGMLAGVPMFLLGVTSNNFAVGRLGRKWKKLHMLVFPLALFAALHFFMSVRGDDKGEAVFYLAAFALLILYRLGRWGLRARRRRAAAA
ncbi:MAG: ferric reductase-like transmembrane domain-containing protein [Betaproteobacteria bacterium AqS2]|uniref:Protein-methionine-sulfoxide reductase heme-binding subunit MsrQ n=1 Tax=Candidatus Amphirhobacter heronislandensis TaxID=1732024 RepID=A0A930UHM6_9GAMM|nr:ferric reductase-like transmembrane domain-containing protein [Betaproteobacteria bacterium AqS2]